MAWTTPAAYAAAMPAELGLNEKPMAAARLEAQSGWRPGAQAAAEPVQARAVHGAPFALRTFGWLLWIAAAGMPSRLR